MLMIRRVFFLVVVVVVTKIIGNSEKVFLCFFVFLVCRSSNFFIFNFMMTRNSSANVQMRP